MEDVCLLSIASRVLKIYLYTLAYSANQGSRFLFEEHCLVDLLSPCSTASSLASCSSYLSLYALYAVFSFPLLFFDISVLHNRDPRPSFGRMMGHLLMNRMFSRNYQSCKSVVAQTRPQALKQDLHYNNDSDFAEASRRYLRSLRIRTKMGRMMDCGTHAQYEKTKENFGFERHCETHPS
jgi:hypothetical protein